jgi:hypothetical protein
MLAALGLEQISGRLGGRTAEHTPEHLERRIDPSWLVDRRFTVALDAGDEQHHEDALAPAAQQLR